MLERGLDQRDLIKTAKELVASSDGKPRQSNLNRAISTTYYALFHTLARCCADTMIGGSNASRSKAAWRQVYRALDHNFVKEACQKKIIRKFPRQIQDFANAFVSMQEKRHAADYDPHSKAYKSAVLIDIESAEIVMADFQSTSLKDRKAFAAWVLFKTRGK
jgi:uncharacterized protein (UPF0332 family)